MAALTLGAFALRVAALGDGLSGVPPGLHVDEAHNGVDALVILAGARPLYLAGNDGREALYSYVQALTVGALGPRVWSLRLASAFLGTLTVPLTWRMVRRMPLARRRPAAVVAAALMAGLFWHVHFSRLAIRGVLLPLVAAGAGAALWRAAAGGGTARWRWLAAGAAYGLAPYAHPAGRLLPLAPALWLGGAAAAAAARGDGPAARAAARRGALLAGGAAAAALPLALWAAAHPALFAGHAAAVSVLDPAVGGGRPGARILINAARLARATVWRGSDSWYHNLAGRPIFDPLAGAAFLAGLAWLAHALARGARRRPAGDRAPDAPGRGRGDGATEASAAGFLAAWLAVMALPTVLTGGAPNFSRAIGLLPALVVPAAVALAAAGAALDGRRGAAAGAGARAAPAPAGRRRAPAGPATLGLGLVVAVAAAIITGRDLFGRYAASPEPARAFGREAVAAGAALAAAAADGGPRLMPSALVTRRSVLRYLTAGAALTPLDLARGLVVPADGRARYALAAGEEADAAAAFAARWPSAPRGTLADADGTVRWLTFGVPRLPPPAPDGPIWGGAIALDAVLGPDGTPGALVAAPGAPLEIALVWRAAAAPTADWTTFVHLVADDDGEAGAGQDDGQPAGGWYPTSRWRAGERVVARHAPVVDPGATGRLRLRVGWYDPASGARLALPGDEDAAAEVATVDLRP